MDTPTIESNEDSPKQRNWADRVLESMITVCLSVLALAVVAVALVH